MGARANLTWRVIQRVWQVGVVSASGSRSCSGGRGSQGIERRSRPPQLLPPTPATSTAAIREVLRSFSLLLSMDDSMVARAVQGATHQRDVLLRVDARRLDARAAVRTLDLSRNAIHTARARHHHDHGYRGLGLLDHVMLAHRRSADTLLRVAASSRTRGLRGRLLYIQCLVRTQPHPPSIDHGWSSHMASTPSQVSTRTSSYSSNAHGSLVPVRGRLRDRSPSPA